MRPLRYLLPLSPLNKENLIMNIGDVAALSGLPAKTIRYYEDIGLVKPLRSTNGYRIFRESDAHKLAFPDVPVRLASA